MASPWITVAFGLWLAWCSVALSYRGEWGKSVPTVCMAGAVLWLAWSSRKQRSNV